MDEKADNSLLCDTLSLNVPTPSSSTPRDARAARSSRSLSQALLALIRRKPLEQITVREIAAEAGVHYATFFRHHAGKEALLEQLATQEIAHLVALTLRTMDAEGGLSSIMILCGHVNEDRLLWTALLTGGAAAAMRAEWLRVSRDVAAKRAPDDGWLPVELGVNCSVTLIFETMAWWLGPDGADVPIAEVAAILHRLLSPLTATGTEDAR